MPTPVKIEFTDFKQRLTPILTEYQRGLNRKVWKAVIITAAICLPVYAGGTILALTIWGMPWPNKYGL